MDYKEKLRLAKEALDSGSYDKETIEYIFPELKESGSEDEKIRKECIAAIKTAYVDGENRQKWIDWLEKQGKKSHCNGEVNDETLQKQLQIWFDKGKCSGRDEVIFHPENFGLQKQCEQRIISKIEPIVEGLTTEFQKQVSHLIASAQKKMLLLMLNN